MKNALLFCFAICYSISSYADGTSITGSTSVLGGATETYYVNWEAWSTTYQYYANVSWNVAGGTVISSDKSSVTVQWNSTSGFADGNGSIEVYEDLGGQGSSLGVTVENNTTSTSEFCSGILGPAKVFVDFGSGSNPGPALSSGSTSYTYSTGCSLNVGEYTITNSSNLCRTAWHNITADHTGNPNGYFLMLNASSAKNEIYRTSITGLTTSFRYQFSAWVGNLYSSSGAQDPNIRFEIYDGGGSLIATSGSIPVPTTIPTFQWQQIGFMFDLPQNVSMVTVVVLNARTATADVGNDMVIDDISFAPCFPGILASFSNSSIVDKEHTCNNGTVNLYATFPSSNPFSSPSYQWQRSTDNGASWSNISGANSSSYTQTESSPGVYQYRMFSFETSNPSLNVTSNQITYYVQSMSVVAKTFDLYACNGAAISDQLPASFNLLYSDPADNQTYTFLWSPGTYLSSTGSQVPTINLPGVPPPTGTTPAPVTNYTYSLTVTNTNYGCTATATQTVAVHNPRKVGVANSFSPNGDGVHDTFFPIALEDYPGSHFWIMNRWGSVVFNSYGPTKADYTWDGRVSGVLQPQEVYAWYIVFAGCPAWINSSSGEGQTSGDLSLFR